MDNLILGFFAHVINWRNPIVQAIGYVVLGVFLNMLMIRLTRRFLYTKPEVDQKLRSLEKQNHETLTNLRKAVKDFTAATRELTDTVNSLNQRLAHVEGRLSVD